ncbi:hypothetical protein IW262DRAFT_1454685 [Armillaria fumosa]|nr:hypothetical protein IW262DRAFT_1454685 [Armillaria fumosa]
MSSFDFNDTFSQTNATGQHLEQSARHPRDYEEGDGERCPDGWEDELVHQQQEEENREDPVALENVEEQAPMSRVEVAIAILNLKKRLQRQSTPTVTVKQTCPVCLCPSSKMSVMKCGHVFCSSTDLRCIRETFEKSQGCPSHRKRRHAAKDRFAYTSMHSTDASLFFLIYSNFMHILYNIPQCESNALNALCLRCGQEVSCLRLFVGISA